MADLAVGDRALVTGPGVMSGEAGIVRSVRDDGALLFESEVYGDSLWVDPRCVVRLEKDPCSDAGDGTCWIDHQQSETGCTLRVGEESGR